MPGFIESDNVNKPILSTSAGEVDLTALSKFIYIHPIQIDAVRKEELQNHEIIKWFEDKITIVCTGMVNRSDWIALKSITAFLNVKLRAGSNLWWTITPEWEILLLNFRKMSSRE
ncbi:MAG: hypothetical protein MZV70_41990 [Desulfobacterales bacterium]|nr:hypothetical protein [Desulfobacterales bacterium]